MVLRESVHSKTYIVDMLMYSHAIRETWALGRPRIILLATFALTLLAACGPAVEKEAAHLERAIAFYDENNDGKALVELRNVLQLNPRNAQALFYLGRVHERAQRWPQAYSAFVAATTEKPDLIPAQVKLGTLALMDGNLDAAEKAGGAIERVAPGQPDGLALTGAVMLRRGDLQRAQEVAEAALALSPDHENANAVMVGVLQARNRTEDALARLEKLIAAKPGTASFRLLKLAILEQKGDSEGVIRVYGELMAQEPGNLAYPMALASFHEQRQDLGQAEAVLRQMMERGVDTAATVGALVRLVQQQKGNDAAEEELHRRIERKPDDHALRFLLAGLLLQQQKRNAAEQALQEIITRAGEAPASLDAQATLAEIKFAGQEVEVARRLAGEVLAKAGNHLGANIVRGVVALHDRDWDEAIRRGRTALRENPNSTAALRVLAMAHSEKNEPDLAFDALSRIVTLEPNDTRSAARLSELLIRRGDQDGALKLWNGIIASSDTPEARRARAALAIQQQNWMTAQADIERLLQTPGEEASAALLAANLSVAQGQFGQSRDWFRKVQTLEPDADMPIIGMVQAYVAENRIDDALAYLKEHAKTKSEHAVAYALMGELYLRQNRPEAAVEPFRMAVELQPEWMNPYRHLARVLVTLGRSDEAIRVYQDALARQPSEPTILADLASTYLDAGQFDAAIEAYAHVFQKQPGNDVAINNYAALIADHRYDRPEQIDQAAKVADRFQTSDNPHFLDTLGWLRYRKNDFLSAATFLERAVSAAPQERQFRYHLGMALYRSGQKERALEELRKAVGEGSAYIGLDEAKHTYAKLQAES